MLYRPRDAAQQLGIAPSTLRLWSAHFANQLSNSARRVATTGGLVAQRRYTEDDLRFFSQIKQWLGQGLTYEEVKRRLRPPAAMAAVRAAPAREHRSTPPVRGSLTEEEEEKSTPVSEIQLSVAGLKETIEAKDKTIAALRESLGFLDVYLHAIKEERDDARERLRQMEIQLEEQRAMARELERQLLKPWWKRVLGLP